MNGLVQQTVDLRDYSNKFNTQLTPKEELLFLEWAKQNNRLNDVYDYDLRGAYRELMSGAMKEAANGHLGDKYKKPNHPTFSNQSIYHDLRNVGGHWAKFGNVDVFVPSNSNSYIRQELQHYFKTREPNSILIDMRK